MDDDGLGGSVNEIEGEGVELWAEPWALDG